MKDSVKPVMFFVLASVLAAFVFLPASGQDVQLSDDEKVLIDQIEEGSTIIKCVVVDQIATEVTNYLGYKPDGFGLVNVEACHVLYKKNSKGNLAEVARVSGKNEIHFSNQKWYIFTNGYIIFGSSRKVIQIYEVVDMPPPLKTGTKEA